MIDKGTGVNTDRANESTLSGTPRVRAIVVQDGARLHYAVPLAFQHAGCLERMFTSWYAPPASLPGITARVLRVLGYKSASAMMHRYSSELLSRNVRSNSLLSVREHFASRHFTSNVERHRCMSRQMGSWVRRQDFGNANVLFGFTGNIDPALLAFAKSVSLATVADQYITPFDIQIEEDDLQHERFPGWSSAPRIATEPLWRSWEQESWQSTDYHTCASEYVRDGLLKMGVKAERISVLPYPIDSATFGFVDRAGRKRPIKVGFVGGVGLRKGAPYFLEVAKRFPRAQVEFVMVGPVQLAPEVIEDFRRHVTVVGPVPRSEIHRWLHEFDIFFFPTTCEGSAGAVMEAMATGLPVITSPNAGSIIEHGKDGFIFPYADIEAHAEAIERLCRNDNDRLAMGRATRAAAEAHSIEDYSVRWRELLEKIAPLAASWKNPA